jgi:hypothetical protein
MSAYNCAGGRTEAQVVSFFFVKPQTLMVWHAWYLCVRSQHGEMSPTKP